MQIASLWIILMSLGGMWRRLASRSHNFFFLEDLFSNFSNSPESFLCRFSSSVRWPLAAELSSVFRFLATSDRGSRSSCCEPSPMFRRSSVFDWIKFCDSSKRNCCWCRRFLMRKIFGISEPFFTQLWVELCFSQFSVGFVTETSLENSARLRNSHFYSLFTILACTCHRRLRLFRVRSSSLLTSESSPGKFFSTSWILIQQKSFDNFKNRCDSFEGMNENEVGFSLRSRRSFMQQ